MTGHPDPGCPIRLPFASISGKYHLPRPASRVCCVGCESPVTLFTRPRQYEEVVGGSGFCIVLL